MTDKKKTEVETRKKREPKQLHLEDQIDEAVEESFPASDPPSTSDPSRER